MQKCCSPVFIEVVGLEHTQRTQSASPSGPDTWSFLQARWPTYIDRITPWYRTLVPNRMFFWHSSGLPIPFSSHNKYIKRPVAKKYRLFRDITMTAECCGKMGSCCAFLWAHFACQLWEDWPITQQQTPLLVLYVVLCWESAMMWTSLRLWWK